MRHNGGQNGNGERRPAEIQAEIERTRSAMDGTLHAIEERLTPGQLVDQGLDYLRHSGANEFVSNLGGAVKQNPIPVALMGIGLAWMMALGRQPAQHESSWSSGHLAERARGAMDSLRGTAHSAMDSVRGTSQSTMDSLGSSAQSARERASHLGDAAGEQMHRARDQMYRARDQVRSGFDTMMREQPLVLGAIGLAIGAILGAAAPRTRQEDELMGEASDRLAERVTEAGKEQMEKVEQVATAAKDAAKQKANSGGPHGTRRVP